MDLNQLRCIIATHQDLPRDGYHMAGWASRSLAFANSTGDTAGPLLVILQPISDFHKSDFPGLNSLSQQIATATS
jgi:hypothetical protein